MWKNKIAFCLCVLVLTTCALFPNTDKIQAIKIIGVLPRFDFSTGKIYGYDTSTVFIFNYKNIELYKMYYDYHTETDDTLITQRLIHYFVHNKGENWGYDYDESKKFIGIKISIDSIFKNEWVTNTKLYPIFGEANNIKLISSYKSKNLDTLKESFFLKSKIYTNQSCSVFLEYSKSLGNVYFSLSKELDSIKNMTLYKFRIVNDPMKVNDTFTMGKYELNYEMQKVDIFNKQEILGYIDKFKAEKLK